MRDIKFQYIFKNGDNFQVETYDLNQLEYSVYEDIQFHNERGFQIIARRQYTGLKDKNGVEIYEGDIVRNAGIKEVVKMELREYSGNQHNFGSVSISILYAYDPEREVIGNIHQNPELLEDK